MISAAVIERTRAAGFTHAVVNAPPSGARPDPLRTFDTIFGMENFGILLNRLRGGRLSQADLAVRAATSQSYVSRVEHGTVQPTLSQAEHLLRCLGYQLKLEVEPLRGRSDRAGLPDQLVMSAEERMESAAALHNVMVELRG